MLHVLFEMLQSEVYWALQILSVDSRISQLKDDMTASYAMEAANGISVPLAAPTCE